MATNTSAELDAFDCNLGESGLDEFEPEPERGGSWPRATGPTAVEPGAAYFQRQPSTSPSRARGWLFALPVLFAASLVGAVVTWVNIRPGEVGLSLHVAPRAAPAPPAAAPAPPAAAAVPTEPLESAVIPTPPVSAPAVPAAAVEPAPTVLDPGVEQTLTRISDAYRALDATSVAAIWPGADTAALSESFSRLKYQALTFERCRMLPNGSGSVVVRCEVSIATASKADDPGLQRRHESWTLALDRAGDQWTIAGLTVR